MHQATVEQVKGAVEAAYRAQGVKNFTYHEVTGLWDSPVQHSAVRTKVILKDAVGRLERKGLAHNLRVVHSHGGQAFHFLAH